MTRPPSPTLCIHDMPCHATCSRVTTYHNAMHTQDNPSSNQPATHNPTLANLTITQSTSTTPPPRTTLTLPQRIPSIHPIHSRQPLIPVIVTS
ncbi:hypothetical protein T440DRAFT_463083 [Plenodomus tracheiphilus IPT5]|uniref:Uncharacterized protein n=1 Tax=Plenodomus tracheiphilus IPT5 TaxID=1408161 RepID=A0A6A7BPM6_9PLEO|nr:hypothetical protein T440DRAFT_463083 [Plenodomus tracheiphilus IPT5]